MRTPMKKLVVVAVLCPLLCSCGGEEPFRKETFPVTGEVYVDGQPGGMLRVKCHDVKGLDTDHPTLSSALTDASGKFQISTYEASDGVPEGEYVLTFMWGTMNLLKGNYGGPDKLNDRYTDPETSEHRFTVVAGKPNDLGRIELTAGSSEAAKTDAEAAKTDAEAAKTDAEAAKTDAEAAKTDSE